MTFKQQISAFTLGLLADKDLPNVALAGLEEGYDSDSLRILAGLAQTENPFLLFEYFNKALSELKLPHPNSKEALVNVLRFHATKIFSRQVDAFTEFEKVRNIISKTEFNYHDINLEKCYADYISIWEVKNDGLQLHEGLNLTKEEYIDITKKHLVLHMAEWLKSVGYT